jgi:ubiquinone/menaquinone biosynthesis C-methylase UbiE
MAEVYKKLTVDVSIRPINFMLEKANDLLPFSEATGILDNGCGPGPVISRLLKNYKIPESCPITCSDFSEGMINQVKQSKEENVKADANSPWNRVEAVVQNAMDLKSVKDSSRSHVTAGWVQYT